MDNIAKIILDCGFNNFDEILDTLRNGERENENSNLFFENAMGCIEELYKYALYQANVIRTNRNELDKQYQTIEQLGGQNKILSEKLHTANEMIKASKNYFKSDFRF